MPCRDLFFLDHATDDDVGLPANLDSQGLVF